ncbi:MAG: xanthine dehydrogenase family protein molybdopterin-binding subunit [Deltaproteobacteria bacterium]|nr:xanthine dehydrogenase family protein molybdopterin-binding subunit [Deltaproteobacteria bacterium]
MAFNVIGQRVVRKDQVAKATGTAQYTVDVQFPDTLHAVTLKSPHAHARINDIDTSEAEKMPGVRAVLCYKSKVIVPGATGGYLFDLYVMPDKVVNFPGQVVAALAAETKALAEEAIKLIKVDYTPLPAVFDPREALKPGAPLIHPEMREKRPDLPDNVAPSDYLYRQSRGDLDKGKKDAAVTAAAEYTVLPESHYRPETNNVIARWEGDQLKFWVTSQGVHMAKGVVCKALNLPETNVTGYTPWVGCGFGGRFAAHQMAIYAAALAKMTGRPVRIATEVDENQVINTHSMGPHYYSTKGGIKKDGTPTFLESVFHCNVGGIVDGGYTGVYPVSEAALAVYNYESCAVENFPVWCNLNPSGARRSYGGAEGMFCSESFIDEMLEKIDADPVAWRLKWAQKTGDPVTIRLEWGELAGCNYAALIKKAAAAFRWQERWKGWRVPTFVKGSKRRGIGIALGMHVTGDPTSERGLVRINTDGTVDAISQGCDIGQGIRSAMCQCVAEALGVKFEQVRVSAGDTSFNPMGQGVRASRGTPLVIGAAIKAALDAKRQVLEAAAPMLQAKPEELEWRQGKVFLKSDPAKFIPFFQVAMKACGFIGTATEFAPKINPATKKKLLEKSNVAMCAEVEVDIETGGVRLLDAVLAGDCGVAINPDAVRQQMDGSIIFGLSFGMHGQLIYDKSHNGVVLNASPNDYKIPTFLEYEPNFQSIIHEDPADAPTYMFNLKGVGEGACIPVAPAIANAIYNACGARVRHHPITPEQVLKALGKI